MANGCGRKRLPGPGKKIGRPLGSKNRPRAEGALKDRTQPLLFSRRSAARELGISVRTIDCAIAAGLLEARRLKKRALISYHSLRKFAASDRVIPGTSQRGGKRLPGPGKKIGRPLGSTKLLAMAAALAGVVPKSL